jgi:hypothetical protein
MRDWGDMVKRDFGQNTIAVGIMDVLITFSCVKTMSQSLEGNLILQISNCLSIHSFNSQMAWEIWS